MTFKTWDSKKDIEGDFEGYWKVVFKGDLEGGLSEWYSKGDFKQDLEGDLLSRSGPGQV